MSHNINTVNNAKPDIGGDINQSLNDLNDVSLTSVSDGQFIQYENSSSAWKNVAAPSASFNYMQIGQGQSDAYSNSGAGATIGAGDKLRFYDTSIINNITGASVTSSSNWVSQITIPAGDYLIFCTYRTVFSSSGYLVYQLGIDTGSGFTALTYNAVIGADTTTHDNAAGQIVTFYQASGNTDIAVLAQAVSNVDSVANQGNVPAEHSTLMILKV